MPVLNTWLRELAAHSGAIVRALLQHPIASEVITNLLTRGQQAADLLPEGSSLVTVWRETTEALSQAYVEAE
jgi:hypothetical protein